MRQSLNNFITGCVVKVAYSDHTKAMAAADKVRAQYKYTVTPYLCPHCMKYHLTKRSPDKKGVSKYQQQKLDDIKQQRKDLQNRKKAIVIELYSNPTNKNELIEELSDLRKKIQLLLKME